MQNLIVGIDPGTTLAYSLLTLDGELISLKSSKQLSFQKLTLEVIKHGKALVVASDVNPVPEFLLKFASTFNTRIVYPNKNLQIKEKRFLTENFPFKNNHERDALSASLFAYKKFKPLLHKIYLTTKKNGKLDNLEKIQELVIKQNMPIDRAISLVEEKHLELKKLKVVTPTLKINQEIISDGENAFLKNQIIQLKSEIENLKKELNVTNRKLNQDFQDKKLKQRLNFKEQQILLLDQKIQQLSNDKENIKEELSVLQNFLSNLNENIILKRLNTLSYNELQEKNKILNIKENDFLLIDDPSIISNKTLDFLKNKVFTILIKKKYNLPNFNTLDANKLDIQENKYFALLNRKQLEKALKEKNILTDIIKEYKKERKLNS